MIAKLHNATEKKFSDRFHCERCQKPISRDVSYVWFKPVFAPVKKYHNTPACFPRPYEMESDETKSELLRADFYLGEARASGYDRLAILDNLQVAVEAADKCRTFLMDRYYQLSQVRGKTEQAQAALADAQAIETWREYTLGAVEDIEHLVAPPLPSPPEPLDRLETYDDYPAVLARYAADFQEWEKAREAASEYQFDIQEALDQVDDLPELS